MGEPSFVVDGFAAVAELPPHDGVEIILHVQVHGPRLLPGAAELLPGFRAANAVPVVVEVAEFRVPHAEFGCAAQRFIAQLPQSVALLCLIGDAVVPGQDVAGLPRDRIHLDRLEDIVFPEPSPPDVVGPMRKCRQAGRGKSVGCFDHDRSQLLGTVAG